MTLRCILFMVVGALLTSSLSLALAEEKAIQIGSKKFTESVILGEVSRLLVESSGHRARHRAELGGTRILWSALLNGDIDTYPEYTGTLTEEILAGEKIRSREELRAALERRGILMSEPLGFNNTYALGVKKEKAGQLGIRTIGDLSRHPGLRLGLSAEFRQREDGWPRIRRAYALPHRDIRGLDHDVAYRALEGGDIDVVDLYSTDAEIDYYDLLVLEDDRQVFPRYEAVLLIRKDLQQQAPAAFQALRRLEGTIQEAEMIAMNSKAKIERIEEATVAEEFARSRFSLTTTATESATVAERIRHRTIEHLNLVIKSLLAAIVVGVPLGVWAASRPALGQAILTVVGIIQTIPALALLVLLISPLKAVGLPGIGDPPAIVALFLYSLLPIVRNTHAGLMGISPQLRESAEALGLSPASRMRLVFLPLATPSILAGIKTAAVLNVGFATLGALVGAGGYGQPILAGIRLDDYALILQGAVPSAALAVLTQVFFEVSERFVVSPGIRR